MISEKRPTHFTHPPKRRSTRLIHRKPGFRSMQITTIMWACLVVENRNRGCAIGRAAHRPRRKLPVSKRYWFIASARRGVLVDRVASTPLGCRSTNCRNGTGTKSAPTFDAQNAASSIPGGTSARSSISTRAFVREDIERSAVDVVARRAIRRER